MRLFTATLATETNTFSPLPTSIENYRESVFLRPGEHPADAPRMCTAPLFVGRKRAEQEGFELIEGSCFAASPAGTTNRADYETMRDEILDQLKAAMPVDGLLLGLHGAMVAHGYDDVEGDIIERARAIVGPKCVIGVELDPHCHLTLKRVSGADIIVLYKEFPHTDVVERAEDVLDLVLATLRGEVKPVMSVYDCRQIQSYPTTIQPMRGLVDRIKAMEGKDGILSVSIAHCFPYGDVAEIGTRVLVIADGDKKKADALATRLGEELVSLRGKTAPPSFDVAGGVAEGVAFNDLPVVIADPADNAGGGAPSDNTDILRHLIDSKVENACLGPIWDPIAVRICFDAGLGAKIGLQDGRQDRAELRPAGRCRGRDHRPQARCLAALRSDAGSGGRLCRRAGRRRRRRADHQAHAGDRPRTLHQSRHRSDAEEDRGREVDQSFHGGLRADRQEGGLCRIERAVAARSSQGALYKGGAADLAARSGRETAGTDLLIGLVRTRMLSSRA